ARITGAVADQVVSLGERRVRVGTRRIDLDRSPQVGEALLETAGRELAQLEAAPQISLVGVRIDRARGRQALLLARRELHPDSLRDRRHDLVLQGEDVLEPA